MRLIIIGNTVLQDEVAEFLGGILSHGPMVQESVVVDLSDLDLRKHKKSIKDIHDELDGETFGTHTMVLVYNSLFVVCFTLHYFVL
jgi:hypothetical protein